MKGARVERGAGRRCHAALRRCRSTRSRAALRQQSLGTLGHSRTRRCGRALDTRRGLCVAPNIRTLLRKSRSCGGSVPTVACYALRSPPLEVRAHSMLLARTKRQARPRARSPRAARAPPARHAPRAIASAPRPRRKAQRTAGARHSSLRVRAVRQDLSAGGAQRGVRGASRRAPRRARETPPGRAAPCLGLPRSP